MKRGLVGGLCIAIAISLPVISAKSEPQTWTTVMSEPTHERSEQSLSSEQNQTCCPIVELRQYTLYPGKRDTLMDLFDREFVESQEAVGMTLIGQFRDLDKPIALNLGSEASAICLHADRRYRSFTMDPCGRRIV